LADDKIHVEITTKKPSAEVYFEPYCYSVSMEAGDVVEADLLPDGDLISLCLREGLLILWCDVPRITRNGVLEIDCGWLPTPAPKYDLARVKATVTSDRTFIIRFAPHGHTVQINENDALSFYFAPTQKLQLQLSGGEFIIGCDELTFGEPSELDVTNTAENPAAVPRPNARAVMQICLPFLEPT